MMPRLQLDCEVLHWARQGHEQGDRRVLLRLLLLLWLLGLPVAQHYANPLLLWKRRAMIAMTGFLRCCDGVGAGGGAVKDGQEQQDQWPSSPHQEC